MDAIADLLSSRTPKRYWSGTHRAVPPRQTWDRIAPLLPRFGITRVADITGLDRINIPVATAIRPMSRSIAVAAGKGVDLVAAKTSAAMEAIECAHADGSLPAAHFRRSDHSTRELLHYPFAIANTRRFNEPDGVVIFMLPEGTQCDWLTHASSVFGELRLIKPPPDAEWAGRG